MAVSPLGGCAGSVWRAQFSSSRCAPSGSWCRQACTKALRASPAFAVLRSGLARGAADLRNARTCSHHAHSVVSHSSVRARLSHGHQTTLNLPTSSGAFDGFVASDLAALSARPAFALGGACGAAPLAASPSSVPAGHLISHCSPPLFSPP